MDGRGRQQPGPARRIAAAALVVAALAGVVAGPAAGTVVLATSADGTLDSRPPRIQLLNPAAGDTLRAAAAETLRWTVTEDAAPGAPPVRFALLAGTEVVWADSVAAWQEGAGALAWTVPDRHLAGARLIATARDAFGWSAADTTGPLALLGSLTDLPPGRAPRRDTVGPAAPNPFNPRTMVPFTLAAPGEVALDIHDAAGRRVARLLRAALPAGAHAVAWDGRDARGRPCPSGVYFARLRVDGSRVQPPPARLTLVK